MLGKLLKHEFRATARVMLPMFAIVLGLSVMGNFSARTLDASSVKFLNLLGGLILAAFFIALFAVCIMSLVIMVRRFQSNLLTDEGYLMLTLPTSVHSLVWSKIIVSVVWFVGTFAVVLLAGLIFSFRVEDISAFIAEMQRFFQQLSATYALDYAAIIAELLIMMFLGCVAICLLFYAAMAVGYGFAKRKALLSVVFFFAFQFAVQFIGTLFFTLFGDRIGDRIGLVFDTMAPMPIWHTLAWSSIGAALIFCAIFYFITTASLKRRLNLE